MHPSNVPIFDPHTLTRRRFRAATQTNLLTDSELREAIKIEKIQRRMVEDSLRLHGSGGPTPL